MCSILLSMWPPLDLLRQVCVLFAGGSPMLDAVEGQNPLPHLLHSLFLVQPRTYVIYINLMSVSPNLSHLSTGHYLLFQPSNDFFFSFLFTTSLHVYLWNLLFIPLILKHCLHIVDVGLLKTPLSHLTGGTVFPFLVYLYFTKTLQSQRLQLLEAAQMYRQQTCLSNLQMKCQAGNDRWSGQTGKNKEQSNSTSRVLDGGHGAAGCDCGVTDCGLQR